MSLNSTFAFAVALGVDSNEVRQREDQRDNECNPDKPAARSARPFPSYRSLQVEKGPAMCWAVVNRR